MQDPHKNFHHESEHSETRMINAVILLATVLISLSPHRAFAASEPVNMVGTWDGKTHTIIAGQGGNFPESTGSFENPFLVEKDVSYTITGQKDLRFWGKVTFTASDGTKTVEPFIGHLTGPDNRSVLMADTDGYYSGTLEAEDKLSYCYAHAGGKTQTTVIGCQTVTKQPSSR